MSIFRIEPRSMKKRFFATTIVALAMVFSHGASVLAAGLCSHLPSNQRSCDSQPIDSNASHHDMDHMQMEPEALGFPGSSTRTIESVEGANGSCSHCAVHSRTNGNMSSLQQVYVASRSHDLTPAVTDSPVTSGFVSEALKLPARAHGPPGDAVSKHVLINVFRI